MKTDILGRLHCPKCKASLQLTPFVMEAGEIRSGILTCAGPKQHLFDIEEGIIRFCAGFDHDAVQRELEYENTTYKGSNRLRDPNLIADFPDTLIKLWPHTLNFGPDFRRLIECLNLKPGAWVLDVGTGPCWSSRLLAQCGFNVTALDVNEADYYGLKTSDILFQKYNIYFDRILESMTHLPFRDETLDAITFNASFHHTPDMEKTLEECFRVLKPGGVAAMVNEEFSSLRQKLCSPEELTDTGSHHTIAYADFERSVRKHGFSIQYLVAEHVRKKLEGKLSPSLGELAVKTMERFPLSLKQLNSAMIILTKPPGRRRAAEKTEELAVSH